MMQEISNDRITLEKCFLSTICYALNLSPLPKIDEQWDLSALYDLAKRHALVPMSAKAVRDGHFADVEAELSLKFSQVQLAAIYHDEKLRYMQETAAKIFQRENIPFVLLKGAVVRQFYPQPWMRTRCDVDILIHPEDVSRALDALTASGFTTDRESHGHEVTLFLDDFPLELHFTLRNNTPTMDKLMDQCWEYVQKKDGCEYLFTPEFFAFYEITHTCKHFLLGGCGVKSLIDLHLLRKNDYYEEEKLLPLLEECGLVKFYRSLCQLCDVWFGGEQYTELTRSMEAFIFRGGSYGTADTKCMTLTAGQNGKWGRIRQMLFPAYEVVCKENPAAEGKKLLRPYYYCHRIVTKVFGKNRALTKSHVHSVLDNDSTQLNRVRDLLSELEIK